jgi:antagonist of KipI
MGWIEVVAPGALTTVQDLGRRGHRAEGVATGGAIDTLSIRVANLLVGNSDDDAALEITCLGPRLTFGAGKWVAIAGAEFDATLITADGWTAALPGWHPVWVPAGGTIACRGARRGCRGMLAISGGIDVPIVLGGRGTDIRSAFGGLDGHPLRAGDRFRIAPGGLPAPADAGQPRIAPRTVGAEFRTGHDGPVRVVRGTEFDSFDAPSREALFAAPFDVSGESDRMGCRLVGPELHGARLMLSQPVVPGTIQVPPSGQPILLLADAPTTGGYPRIAVVATVDLPRVAQARPGDVIRFVEWTLPAATQALRERERALARLARGLEVTR